MMILLCCFCCRELPELAKYYVMRILFVENPVTKPAAAAWVIKDAKRLVCVQYTIVCCIYSSTVWWVL